jgi:pimeloyl-ACP methyl ester carboxylesterase
MVGSGADSNGFSSTFVTAPDGLRLHVRDYGPRLAPNLPVVCLPGLTRSAADFHDLALALAADTRTPRRVLAVDYRGRGLSEYDREPRNYNLATELADVLAVLSALDVARAVFIGTSRGGILTMMLGSARPTAVAGAVLNDIGPVIEPAGLVRIKSYVGKLPRPKNFQDGADILRRLFGHQFTKLSDEQWLAFSRRTFKVEQRGLGPIYDIRLAATLTGIDFDRPLPPLWNEFDSLARIPLMVVRGANSDLLSEETLAAMRARRAELETINVPDQGHAPLLATPDEIARITTFVAACEPNAGGGLVTPASP